MKQPNTRAELLRHAADLDEKGESLIGEFEWRNYDGRWLPIEDKSLDFYHGTVWRIVDKDQYLLDDGWLRHTGDVCPVHYLDEVRVKYASGSTPCPNSSRADDWHWGKDTNITHYKVTKEAYVEPTTFVLDGVTLNRPYESAPTINLWYFAIYAFGTISKTFWRGDSVDLRSISIRNCWKTEEDAIAYQAVHKAWVDKALESKQ